MPHQTALLLPFSCVKDYLEKHPLTQLTGAAVQDIYTAIIEILETEKRSAAEIAPSQPNSSEQQAGSFRCPLCQSHAYTRDIREATVVCECGYCMRRQDGARAGFQRDVPARVHPTEIERHLWRVGVDLRHWAEHPDAGVALGEDEILRAIARASAATCATPTARIVGARWVKSITEELDIDAVAVAVQIGKSLPRLAHKKPPTFRCKRCGRQVQSVWETRRHPCMWGKTPKPASRRAKAMRRP
jgi:transcription elongation factor Elf1